MHCDFSCRHVHTTLHCVSSQSSNSEQAKQFPVANLADLLPLAVAFLNAVRERLEYGLGAILTAWFQQLAQRYAGNGAVMLPLPGKRILLVVDRDFSVHILSKPPSSSAYLPGRLKSEAMELVAPHALTNGAHFTKLCFAQVRPTLINPFTCPRSGPLSPLPVIR